MSLFSWLKKLYSKPKVDLDKKEINNDKKLENEPIKERLPNAFVSFDIETTGLSNNDDLIQVGAVLYSNGEIIDSFLSYVKPKIEIPQTITNLTGITNDDVKHAPDASHVIRQLIKFIDDYDLIGYNSSTFDIPRIKAYTGYDFSVFNHTDVQKLIERSSLKLSNNRLATVCYYYGLNYDNSHDALTDAKNTAEIYLKLINNDFEGVKRKLIDKIDFKDKCFCISGNMDTGRNHIEEIITSRGGIVKSGMSRKVHYLICGPQVRTKGGGKSSKEKYFDELVSQGFDIKKLTENELLDFIESK